MKQDYFDSTVYLIELEVGFDLDFIIIIVNDMKIIKLRLIEYIVCVRTSLVSQMVKNLPIIRETWV